MYKLTIYGAKSYPFSIMCSSQEEALKKLSEYNYVRYSITNRLTQLLIQAG